MRRGLVLVILCSFEQQSIESLPDIGYMLHFHEHLRDLPEQSDIFELPFKVGAETHVLRASLGNDEIFLDGHVIQHKKGIDNSLPEKGWRIVAETTLQSLHVHDPHAAPALARQLAERATWFREIILDRCRKHFVFGGIGMLAFEDIQSLREDSVCDTVADELIAYYRGAG
jgi:hypothetical protein